MFLKEIRLQNFRNYRDSSFSFEKTNIFVGENAAGKTNILEAIYFLSHGESFRADLEEDVINFSAGFARVDGVIENRGETRLGVVLQKQNIFKKRYLVNDIARRKRDFVGNFFTVLFAPQDLETITDSPSLRRRFIDRILYPIDREYARSLSVFEKALKTRNRMLSDIKEGKKLFLREDFYYWEDLLITHGGIITKKREELVEFLNNKKKSVFDFEVFYDKSTITRERLDKYFEIEKKTGATLVGPQRDEFVFLFPKNQTGTIRRIKEFGSRGEQRLTILELRLLEIEFIKKKTGAIPALLLDDIFSELDSKNIKKISGIIGASQIFITTAHEDLIPKKLFSSAKIIKISNS
jgi:DNA replication and repair protein RecF